MLTAVTAADGPLSPWQRQEIASTQPLQEKLTTDVAVVGAGLAGLIAALGASGKGASVAVIEAGPLGVNASSSNAAHVMPMMWGMRRTPQAICARFPGERGERMNRTVAAAGRWLFDLIRTHDLRCESNNGGILWLARSAKSFDKLCAQAAAWQPFGGRFEAVGPERIGAYIASEGYYGGIRLIDAGTLNPLLLTAALAARLQALGVKLFADSPIVSAEQTSGGWLLRTAAGAQLQCKTLLAAPGAEGTGPFAHLSQAGYPVRALVVATDSLPDHGRSILPGGIAVADLDDHAPFGPLIDATGALILSVLPGTAPKTIATAEAILRPRLRRAFPQFGPAPFTRITGGRFLLTSDGVPRLVRIGRNGYAGVGCNGSGHIFAAMLGRDLGALGAEGEDADTLLPISGPRPATLRGPVTALLERLAIPLMNRPR